MPAHGRLLHAKHLFPYLFGPWFQFQRLLLRLNWTLFVPLRIASLWTASAVCGVMGVIGAILLFLFNTPGTSAKASTEEPTVVERIAITIPTDLGPAMPVTPVSISIPVPPPVSTSFADLRLAFARTRLPASWDLRERQTLVSRPQPPVNQNPYLLRDGWFTMNSARHGQMAADLFHPYINRPGVMTASFAPTFSAAESFDPTQPVGPNRTPSIVVSREEGNGPVSLNQEASYTLVVTNPSPELIESAVVEERVSALHRVVNTEPPASLTPDGMALQWNVSNLRSGESRRIRITLTPESSDPIRHQTIVSLTARVAGSTTIRTPYIPPEVPAAPPTPPPAPPQPTRPALRPVLTLDLEQPNQVDLGGDVRAYYVIRNTGDAPATDVVTYVTISGQLDHRYGEYLEHRIPELPPGDSRRIKFFAVGARPGVATLASRLSAANAEPVVKVFEIAIAQGGSPNTGGPGSIDPRTFPGNQGAGTGFGNPAPRPGNGSGGLPSTGGRSTVPSRARPDLDDGLPSRVQSTVPGGREPFPGGNGSLPANPGAGQGSLASPSPGFNSGNSFNPGTGFNTGGNFNPGNGSPGRAEDGAWNGAPGREQGGPLTSPFGQEPLPSSTFPGRDRGNTGMPATDGQWRPNGAADGQPSRSSLPNGSLGNSSIPDDKIRHRRRDDDELTRPNRKVVPEKKVDSPSTVPANPYADPGTDRNLPDQPYNGGYAPAVPGNNSPFPTDLGQPQTIPYSGSRSPDTGSPFPAMPEQPNYGRPAERPTDLFSPEPARGPGGTDPFPGTGGRTRPQPSGRPGLSEEPQPTPFADPFPGNPGANSSSVPFSGNPGGNSPSPLFPGDAAPGMFPPANGPQPAGPGGTSIPPRRPDPVFFDDPVKSTIPPGGIGPMPAVEPQHYPSVLPENGFFATGGQVPAIGTPGRFSPPPSNPQPAPPNGGFFEPTPAPAQPSNPQPFPPAEGGEKAI